MKRDGTVFFAFVLTVLLGIVYFGTTTTTPLSGRATSSAQYSYVLDPRGEQEVGQVVSDPIPIPVSASGLALSRIGVKVTKSQGWVEYREAIVSSVNPPQTGRWVQCLTYYNYHEGIRMRRMISVCNVTAEDH